MRWECGGSGPAAAAAGGPRVNARHSDMLATPTSGLVLALCVSLFVLRVVPSASCRSRPCVWSCVTDTRRVASVCDAYLYKDSRHPHRPFRLSHNICNRYSNLHRTPRPLRGGREAPARRPSLPRGADGGAPNEAPGRRTGVGGLG